MEKSIPPLSLVQSVQNSMVKHAYSLKIPKKAKDSEDFLCEGVHLIQEALKSNLKFRFIFMTKESLRHPEGRKIFEAAQWEKIRCFEVTAKIINYLSDTVTPQGILAVVKKVTLKWPEKPFGCLLGIHQVQDAGNLGTLFRSAEAFGAQGLFLTEGCCDPFNPKVVRSAMGSLFRLPFVTGESWTHYMDWLKKNEFYTCALTQLGTETLIKARSTNPIMYWVGSEGMGLPVDLVSACDGQVNIPMVGKTESLNVGVAASIALFWNRSHSSGFQ